MTATTPEAREQARRLRRAWIAANPDRLCPPDHKHGVTSTCYNSHGCRCLPCRDARSRAKRSEYYSVRKILNVDVKVPVIGAQRRVQALAFMGWSPRVIGERVGMHARPVLRIREGTRAHIMGDTHRLIKAVFDELCMVEAPGKSGQLTRAFARRAGFASPLAWVDIDDPAESPSGLPGGVAGWPRIDRELVERLWGEGLSDAVIADRVGCSARSVLRIREELGLETKWAA